MPDKGTGNAIFVLRRLVQRSVEKQRDVYTCFIDYSKSFDTVKHESLVELLQSLDVDKSETMLLTNLYWKQTAAGRCVDDISEWLDIKHGVRQGSVASHLFALYTKMIMRELDDMDGFRIGGTVVNNLRYADDTVIIAESEEQLQRLINVVVTKSEKKGLHFNKVLRHGVFEGFTNLYMQHQCSRQDTGTSTLVLCLGSQFTSDARCEKEIRRRIGIAMSVFTSMSKVLSSRNIYMYIYIYIYIYMTVRIRVLRCYVW